MNPMSTLPAYETRRLSKWLIQATEAYFENPDVKKRFDAWRKERELNARREIENSETA